MKKKRWHGLGWLERRKRSTYTHGVYRERDGVLLALTRGKSNAAPVAATFGKLGVPCTVQSIKNGPTWMKRGDA